MNKATLRDVAEAAGVHPGTVSRALNPATREMVNAATVRKVIKAAASLGYVPNPVARSLRTAKSGAVGVVVPDLTNPLFPPIVRGVEAVLEEAGYAGLLVNTDDDLQREQLMVDTLRARQVEGLIVATARRDHPLMEQLDREGIPLVMVNRRAERVDVPFAAPDDFQGIRLAVSHLVALGHQRIAHLAGPTSTSTGLARAQAFTVAMSAAGLASYAVVETCDRWAEVDGAAALRQVLDSHPDVTAVVAGNDMIALGCYDVLAERGMRCPDDLSVVGFNDMPFIDKLSPALTTIHVPHVDLGREAARMLLERLAHKEGPAKSVLLQLSLVQRASTGRPPDRRR